MLQMDSPEARNTESVTSAPFVSVIIPAYNAAAYINATLDSVFAQTFSDYEVILVNDGSPDTLQLEKAIEPYRHCVIYHKHENGGPSAARNAGILKARGSYVAFLDSDDLWLPDYLVEQIKILKENPTLDLIYADAVLFGESVPVGLTFMKCAPSRGEVTFENLLRFQCSVITSCVVARKQALIDVGLFDPAFFRSEDYDLWLRLAYSGAQIAYQRQVLARHRVRGESLAADAVLMFESKIEVYQKIARTLNLSSQSQKLIQEQIERCRADIAFERGKQQFISRRFGHALEALREANKVYHSGKLRVVLVCLRVAPRVLWRIYTLRYGLSTQVANVEH